MEDSIVSGQAFHDLYYLNFARVGGFHILINFHARFRY